MALLTTCASHRSSFLHHTPAVVRWEGRQRGLAAKTAVGSAAATMLQRVVTTETGVVVATVIYLVARMVQVMAV